MKWAQNSDSKTSKKELLEQISAKNPYVTFFLGHPVQKYKKMGPKKIDQANWHQAMPLPGDP